MVPEPLCSKIMIQLNNYTSNIHQLFSKIFLVEEQISNIGMQKHYFQERTYFFFRIVMYRFGNGAPICKVCIGWESQCLPYAGVFMECFSEALEVDWEEKGGCFSMLSKYVVTWPFLIIEICRQRIGKELARMRKRKQKLDFYPLPSNCIAFLHHIHFSHLAGNNHTYQEARGKSQQKISFQATTKKIKYFKLSYIFPKPVNLSA